MNDYEEFALDIIQVVIDSGNYKPTEALIKRVGKMIETGPMITVWPRDVAEARQRARDRAIAAVTRRPELPRVELPPTLPRVSLPGQLPRVELPPTLPRVTVPPQLPRVVLK